MNSMENAAVLEFVPEVAEGPLESQSEVVRESLRLLERRNQEERAKLKWLREAVQEASIQPIAAQALY